MEFKKEIPDFKERRNEFERILNNHPNKIPIILEPAKKTKNAITIKQNKFLVPKLFTFHEFLFQVRKRVGLSSGESLYVAVAGFYFPSLDRTMMSIYDEFKDSDGFLYVNFSSEAVWG
ncbi:unnamed protein product [Blepharisma stoltei]|uniref:Autophagy-related protein n=1 Tax=Blepharisma stoltei TaxID=1481888 RepID=A0AAU9K8R7_9CILI|nr:unnamed protein product [Blepharisma stoltei]